MICQEILLRFIFGSLPKSRAIEIYLIKLHKILPIWQIRTMTTPFIREDHVNWFFFHFAFRSALIKLCKEKSKKEQNQRIWREKMVWLPLTLFRGCDTRKILCSSSILEFFCFVYSNFNWWKCQKANISILFIHGIQTRMYLRPIFLNLLSLFFRLMFDAKPIEQNFFNIHYSTSFSQTNWYNLLNAIRLYSMKWKILKAKQCTLAMHLLFNKIQLNADVYSI